MYFLVDDEYNKVIDDKKTEYIRYLSVKNCSDIFNTTLFLKMQKMT